MKIRYKSTGEVTYSGQFNVSAIAEVLTGDDSPFIKDLDVWLEALQCWKDMRKAFVDRDLITDNYNTMFFEPANEADRERVFAL